jgi:DNA-binding YbaB/EbfC family protein
MKAMQQAVSQAGAVEEELAKQQIEATSGGGMVKAVVTGKGDLVEIKINKEVVDPEDVVMLEDLVSMAVRDALGQATALREETMKKMMPSGMSGIPGLF